MIGSRVLSAEPSAGKEGVEAGPLSRRCRYPSSFHSATVLRKKKKGLIQTIRRSTGGLRLLLDFENQIHNLVQVAPSSRWTQPCQLRRHFQPLRF